MQQITVSNCQECPFVHYSSDWGYDYCKYPDDNKIEPNDQMPSDTINPICPLKKESITILVNETKL